MAIKASTTKTTTAKSSEKTLRAVTSDDNDQTEPSQGSAGSTQFIRRKEFVDRIVASSGLKPNVVKSTLDAVLLELGDALSKGEALNLQPLGKISVNRRKDLKNGEMLICKLRRTPPTVKAEAPLADAAE